MIEEKSLRWLEWAREIQALSQTGLEYAVNDYQRERYERLSAIAAQMVSEYSNLDFDTLALTFAKERGDATPRVDVRGAVFQEGRLLMVRERADGGWTLPGGWADVGNVPSEAAERTRPRHIQDAFAAYLAVQAGRPLQTVFD